MKEIGKVVVSLVLGLILVTSGCEKETEKESFENSTTFKQAVEKIGFGESVVLYEKELGESFWNGLKFEQWLDIYQAAEKDSDLEKKALRGTLASSTEIVQSAAIYAAVPIGSEVEQLAEEKMLVQADGLADWFIVYVVARRGTVCEKTAIENICKSCANFNDWKLVYKYSPSDSELELRAVNEMAALASTEEEWMLVFIVSPSGSANETKARQKLGGGPREKPPVPEKESPVIGTSVNRT